MFTVLKSDILLGSSLRRVLPSVSTIDVERVYGKLPRRVANSLEDKYSESLVLKHTTSDQKVTLYAANGQWRIGAADCVPESTLDELERTLLVVVPTTTTTTSSQ